MNLFWPWNSKRPNYFGGKYHISLKLIFLTKPNLKYCDKPIHLSSYWIERNIDAGIKLEIYNQHIL